VYAVGHPALALGAQEQAALLACGCGAVLSHASAAYLWGLLDSPPIAVDVTLVGRQLRPRAGITIHHSARLDERDQRRRDGLLVTSPARTAIDMAADVSVDRLEALVSEGRVKNLIRGGELESALARTGRTSGASRMRSFLDSEEEPATTRSWGERKLRRLLTEARIRSPKFNRFVEGWSVDLLWEEEKLAVEFDSYKFHGHRRAFERDRRKDVALAELGYQVLRFTARQLKYEPLAVITSIARALERRRSSDPAAPSLRH
jgi:very-short-patch-repair endonuclease